MKRQKIDRSKVLSRGEKWLTPKPSGGRRVVQDTKLLRWECYNPNDCAVTFKLMQDKIPYVLLSGIEPGPEIVICKPQSFALLNHSFYIISASDGRELITVTQNFGRWIGVGNKLPGRWEPD